MTTTKNPSNVRDMLVEGTKLAMAQGLTFDQAMKVTVAAMIEVNPAAMREAAKAL
jgi:hypothetical protein